MSDDTHRFILTLLLVLLGAAVVGFVLWSPIFTAETKTGIVGLVVGGFMREAVTAILKLWGRKDEP